MTESQLPREILRQIIDSLEPRFFQQDVGRLTVSKIWMVYARTALYRNLFITPKILSRLALLPETHPSLVMLSDEPRVLRISLHGFHRPEGDLELPETSDEDSSETSDEYDPGEPVSSSLITRSFQREQERMSVGFDRIARHSFDPKYKVRRERVGQYETQLNQHLQFFFRRLQTARRLGQLHIDTETPKISEGCPDQYLHTRTLQDLCDFTTLTVLHLDLNGASVKPNSDSRGTWNWDPEYETGGHLCSHLSGLVGRLVRLRIRMPYVCDLLLPEEVPANSPLKELIVNMSLEAPKRGQISRKEPFRCGNVMITHNGNRHLIESNAVKVAQQLDAPERVRVLYTLYEDRSQAQKQRRDSPVNAFDALTCLRFRLRDPRNWVDDGDGDVYTSYDLFGLKEEPVRESQAVA